MSATTSKFTTVSIPTKTYLKKYLHTRLGTDIFAPGTHHITRFLSILLDKKIFNYNFTALNQQYTDKIKVYVSYNSWAKMGYSISQAHAVEFNNFIEDLFDEELFRFCHDYLKFHKVSKDAIFSFAEDQGIHLKARQKSSLKLLPELKDAYSEFLKIYGMEIEEDVTFECIKKMEYRARKKIEKRESILFQPVPSVHNSQLTLLFAV